jgi:Spy/CpxP family protein refolding chaperone
MQRKNGKQRPDCHQMSLALQALSFTSKRRKLVNKKIVIAALVLTGACFALAPKSLAQAAPSAQSATTGSKSPQQVSDQDIALMRQDIRSEKKQLIAANLTLTDTEATKFWPVYDQYTAELTKINDTKYALIKEYATNWGSVTDEQAASLIKRSLAADDAIAQLRTKYVPIFSQVLPGKKVATFFQLDRRLSNLIDLQLASQIPLVQAQP